MVNKEKCKTILLYRQVLKYVSTYTIPPGFDEKKTKIGNSKTRFLEILDSPSSSSYVPKRRAVDAKSHVGPIVVTLYGWCRLFRSSNCLTRVSNHYARPSVFSLVFYSDLSISKCCYFACRGRRISVSSDM